MGDDLGNVVQSRGFQFAEIQSAHSNIFDGDLIWTTTLPKSFEPVKNRWIYAFAFVGDDQKALLAAEYGADKDAKLTFVPGPKRRLVEPKAAPSGTPVPEAGLPLIIQGRRIKYAFVMTHGRMGKAAIWSMENGLDSIYERMDLADPGRFHADKSQQQYIAAVDILTLAEGLSSAYHRALNEALNYVVVHDKNPNNAVVEVRSRKYELGRMIRNSLLLPGSARPDPLEISSYLAGSGAPLLKFITDHESQVNKRQWASRNAARELVRLFNSRPYGASYDWYLGTTPAANLVGHFWLDVTFRCLDRLNETPEGRALERDLVDKQDDNFLSYLFPPSEESGNEDAFEEHFPIMRKAATAAVVGLAELAPAIIVYSKVRAAALEKIASSFQACLKKTVVTMATRASSGEVTRLLKLEVTTLQLQVNFKQAKPDVAAWIEEGKPDWPEGTRWAKASELCSRLFVAVELVNFISNVNKLGKHRSGKTGVEFFGAALDLAVALEDPIRAYANSIDATRSASAVEDAGAAASGEAEATGLFGKLAAPAVFKALGAVSAAIDTIMYSIEAREAYEHGERATAVGDATVAGGSFLILSASVLNCAGYVIETAAALTAAAASLLVVGIVVVVAGFALIAYFSKSSWQKFARHCCFGDQPASPGFEDWSGGSFSEWTETKEGLDRQIEVLTAMLCAFKVSGTFKMSGQGSDAESVAVTFEAVPPQSKLALAFEIDYVGGLRHKPAYEIDLETLAYKCLGDAHSAADFQPFKREGRVSSILLSADRPQAAENARVARSSCALQIRYAHQSGASSVATGKIPAGGEITYPIYDGSQENLSDVSSLDFKPPQASGE